MLGDPARRTARVCPSCLSPGSVEAVVGQDVRLTILYAFQSVSRETAVVPLLVVAGGREAQEQRRGRFPRPQWQNGRDPGRVEGQPRRRDDQHTQGVV